MGGMEPDEGTKSISHHTYLLGNGVENVSYVILLNIKLFGLRLLECWNLMPVSHSFIIWSSFEGTADLLEYFSRVIRFLKFFSISFLF